MLYRIASVLLVLFAVGHTLGFHTTKPERGVGPLLTSMREIRFVVQGFSRTYWNFYIGSGLFVTVLLLFAALVSWQLGSLSAETLLLMRILAWALALCFVPGDNLELEMLLHCSCCLLHRHNGVSDRSSLALRET